MRASQKLIGECLGYIVTYKSIVMKLVPVQYFLVLSMAIFVISCQPTRVYYNERLAQDYQWTDNELQKLQFYVSEDIVLTRQIRRGDAVIEGGKIKRIQGREIEKIIIKRGTPGTYLFTTTDGNYALTFDASNRQNYLVFGPVAKVRDRYALRAKKWERSFGLVTYGGREYSTPARSAQAFLLINSKGHRTTRVKTKTERGSRLR